jgi:hypothetical protein
LLAAILIKEVDFKTLQSACLGMSAAEVAEVHGEVTRGRYLMEHELLKFAALGNRNANGVGPMIRRMDLDGDGMVDRDDFCTFICGE